MNTYEEFQTIISVALLIVAILNMTKLRRNPALQDSPPAAGLQSSHIPSRRSAIPAERFYSIECNFLSNKK